MSVLDNVNVRLLIDKIKKTLSDLGDTDLLSFDEIFELQLNRVKSLKEREIIDHYVVDQEKKTIDIYVKPPVISEFISVRFSITQNEVSFEDILKEV